MLIFYLIGCILSFILVIVTEYENMKKVDAQLCMIIPAIMLSWVTVCMISYNIFFRNNE